MSDQRGITRTGRPSPLPRHNYEPDPRTTSGSIGTVVHFLGEDGRRREFDIGSFPLPGWHSALTAAWSIRTGPSGGLRTLASANGAWGRISRFIRFIDQLPRAPRTPPELTVDHIDVYRRFRSDATNVVAAGLEVRDLGLLFEAPPLSRLVGAKVLDRLHPRVRKPMRPGLSGYSDAELARIAAAARADVRLLCDRLAQPLPADDMALNAARQTGRVSTMSITAPLRAHARKSIAERLFVTRDDLYPLLVLLILTTGWNLEVIKELPVAHRVIDGRAVELELLKRRRGAGNWHHPVTWEIGSPGQELHTPGGLYLLLHRLMEPARNFLEVPAFWAVWHHLPDDQHRECRNPFAKSLSVATLKWAVWTARHGLLADPPLGTVPAANSAGSVPLRLTANRLKTSIDVRRTRQLGGHLPSAARSNSTRVLFRNYLSGDHTTIDWAKEVVSDAFIDVERAAYDAHRRALTGTGAAELRVVSGNVAIAPNIQPPTDTAWAACADHEHHPATGRRCAVSFMDCFHCGNCVITPSHLPRLLSLLDALEERRARLSDADWWKRYGPVWTAIRRDILSKFSAAEVSSAHRGRPDDSFLDLVEPEWERP